MLHGLGKDGAAVLGHLDDQSIADVVSGDLWALRAAHRDGRFSDISYCKDCDQLYDLPESRVEQHSRTSIWAIKNIEWPRPSCIYQYLKSVSLYNLPRASMFLS